MKMSQSARENGWMSYPADRWNEHKPAPVGPHRFWTHCAERYGGPILEVACGNGRWLFPLAEHGPGYAVVGIDINPGFIASARQFAEKRADAGHAVDATFHVGDIVRLDLGRTFPLAIMTSWTFQVLLTQEDQLSFLERLREHLLPGGAFAFNLFIPFHRQRGLVEKDGLWQWPPNPDYHGGTPRTYDPLAQIEAMNDHNVHPIKLRHTSLSELKLLFRPTGFRIVEIYGDDEDMRPFTGKRDNDYTILAERV
jgi:SAM-dependent methyltransferase